MEAIKYIKRVEIKNLWGEHDIVWDLNQDVNVLAGVNGSGKSTILSLIVGAITGDFKFAANMADKVRVIFNTGQTLVYVPHRKSKEGLKTLLENTGTGSVIFKKAFETVLEEIKKKQGYINESSESQIKDFLIAFFKGDKKETVIDNFLSENVDEGKGIVFFEGDEIIEFQKELGTDTISTFDQQLKQAEALQKVSNENLKTELDLQIFHLQKEYLDYQINIKKSIIKSTLEPFPLSKSLLNEYVDKLNNEEVLSKEEINKLISTLSKEQQSESSGNKLLLFWNTIDDLFKETGKKIDRKSNELTFLKGEKEITPYMLSSGEKQMVVILMTALIQDENFFVMFMDEPEISLHTDWQEKLIENVKKLNENVQLVIATHSPSIIIDGWADKVTEVPEIIINSEN